MRCGPGLPACRRAQALLCAANAAPTVSQLLCVGLPHILPSALLANPGSLCCRPRPQGAPPHSRICGGHAGAKPGGRATRPRRRSRAAAGAAGAAAVAAGRGAGVGAGRAGAALPGAAAVSGGAECPALVAAAGPEQPAAHRRPAAAGCQHAGGASRRLISGRQPAVGASNTVGCWMQAWVAGASPPTTHPAELARPPLRPVPWLLFIAARVWAAAAVVPAPLPACLISGAALLPARLSVCRFCWTRLSWRRAP